MLIGPKGERRPKNPVEAAIMAARILTGDLQEEIVEDVQRPPDARRPRWDSNPRPTD